MKILTLKIECRSCDATGLYRGFGECEGAAVVCKTCKGTGCEIFSLSYTDFSGRRHKPGVKRVVEVNPGIGVGPEERFGGMPYADWLDGKPFPPKSEMREHVCPAWWYQCANYELKPRWDTCLGCGAFPMCKHFNNKHECWARFDKEHPELLGV